MALFFREFLRRVFLRDHIVLWPLLAAVILQILNWGFLIWRGLPLQNQETIPLHYNIYFGVDLLGPWYGIFLPAGFGFLALVINTVLVILIYEKQRLLAYFFAASTALLELILLAASFFTILLNF